MYVFRDQAAVHIAHVMGGVHTSARADVLSFSYLWNGWMDRAEIWCAVWVPLAKRFTKVTDEAQPDLCSAYLSLFRISGMTETMPLKYDVYLKRHFVCC